MNFKKQKKNEAQLLGIAIAAIHDKGGSGTSTTTYNFAVLCARMGYKTTVVDLDEQATLHKTFNKRDFSKTETRNILKRLVNELSDFPFPNLQPINKPVIKPIQTKEPQLLEVVQLGQDENIIEKIQELRKTNDYVFIDTRNGIAKKEIPQIIKECDASFIPYFTNSADLDTAEHARFLIKEMKEKEPNERFNINSVLIVENYSSLEEVKDIARWFTNRFRNTHPLLPFTVVRRNVYRRAFNFGRGVCEMSGEDAYTAAQELEAVLDALLKTI